MIKPPRLFQVLETSFGITALHIGADRSLDEGSEIEAVHIEELRDETRTADECLDERTKRGLKSSGGMQLAAW